MELALGMRIETWSVQGQRITGHIEKVNEHTIVVRSSEDGNLYLARLETTVMPVEKEE